jgi:hypothetical protein
MNDRHDPDPAFLSHLERETRFALRRAREERTSGARDQLFGRLRSAAIAVLSLGLGAGVVLAAQELEDRRWSEQRLARNEIKRELAEKKLEVARQQEELVAHRLDAGWMSHAAARDVARRMSVLKREALLLALEHEELLLGGRPPERLEEVTLVAPLVRSRDFVRERLQATREVLALREESLRADFAVLESRVRMGAVPTASLEPARVDVESASRALSALDQKLSLRADFVQGRLSATECERAAMVADAEANVAERLARVELARQALRVADHLHTRGYAPAPDTERIALAEAEAELALAELELSVLR